MHQLFSLKNSSDINNYLDVAVQSGLCWSVSNEELHLLELYLGHSAGATIDGETRSSGGHVECLLCA
ncbi:hypothetical protein EB796_017867 [Bugula neritina]|uniref:Uncharacterized protein n=1 Tax=Bugula neritina TaxID=10212 RepID=A0A7J7JC52_BUGNE|nr:hypothetical protein EB796_017867 [Bugula neritina]